MTPPTPHAAAASDFDLVLAFAAPTLFLDNDRFNAGKAVMYVALLKAWRECQKRHGIGPWDRTEGG